MIEWMESRRLLSVAGTAGDDVIRVGGSAAAPFVVINGTRTNLSIGPGGTAIVIDAGTGNDFLQVDNDCGFRVIAFGGGGNDTLLGGPKGDTLIGQSGNDLIRGLAGGDYCIGGAGNDVIKGDNASDSLVGDGAPDQNGSPYTDPTTEIGDDTIAGGESADTLNGGGGNDLIAGNEGDDIFVFRNTGAAIYDGGVGANALLVNTDQPFNLTLDKRSDDGLSGQGARVVGFTRFSLDVGPTSIIDLRRALSGVFIDWVRAASGTSASGPVLVYGSGFDDIINALYTLDNTQPLAINAGAGNDQAYGNGGNDRIEAGTGNDTVNSLGGNDVISGGDGNDDLKGYEGNDTISAGAGNDLVQGESGADRIFGNTGSDTLVGGSGNDRLFGGPDAADLLGGGAGSDIGSDDSKDTVENVETILAGIDAN